MKAMRQPLSLLSGLSRPPKMPLMPAIRPVSSISRTAERPISAPPIAADSGVKFAMDHSPSREPGPAIVRLNYRRVTRNRKALPTTLTDDSAMAAAAMIGDSSRPNVG